MSATLFLFWLALSAAGPETASASGAESVQNVLGQPLLSRLSAAEKPSNSLQLINGIDLGNQPTSIRAQSCEPDPPEFVLASPCPRGIDACHLHELIDLFNPFSKEPVRVIPGYYDPYGWQGSYGTDGYQPWRLGWSLYHDLAVMPFASVSGGSTGEMKIVEWNSYTRLSELIAPGVLFNGTGFFNARYWDGPGGTALPGQVDQISLDLELGFFNEGPWSGQIAFHPQIVDGYEQPLNNYAFNFDGRAIAMYLLSPNWSLVGGLGVWDRVDVLVVPHVGAIWTPNSRWELRLLYPRSRISYYLGRRGKTDFWLYGVAEYTAEAWQANIGDPTIVADRIQLTDDRVTIGLRWDTGRHSIFVEGGIVFNRQAKFIGPTPDFDLSNVGTIRAGFRF